MNSPTQPQLGFLDSASTTQLIEELSRRVGASGWINEPAEVFHAMELHLPAITQAALSGMRVRTAQRDSAKRSHHIREVATAVGKLKNDIVSGRPELPIDHRTKDAILGLIDRHLGPFPTKEQAQPEGLGLFSIPGGTVVDVCRSKTRLDGQDLECHLMRGHDSPHCSGEKVWPNYGSPSAQSSPQI